MTPMPVNPALQQGSTTVLGSEIEEILPCGLTPAQKKEWQGTMSLMLWTCPGFRHLFYKLLNNNDGEYGCVPTQSVPVAATDQKNIMINPGPFFHNYTMKERVFIMGHEVVHNIYNDVDFLRRCAISGTVPMSDGTTLPFHESTMQKSMDFRINALLRDSNIGSVPKDAHIDDTIAKANDGVVDVYKRVYEDEEQGGPKTGPRGNPGGFDLILKPSTSTPNKNAPNPQQWAVEIKKAQMLEAMKAQGRGKGALLQMFEDVLNPVVPWTDHIRGIFNKKVGSGSFNWKRPNRRAILQDIFLPSKSGNGAGWVACWGDSSGSVIALVNKYLPELKGILEDCQPRRLTIVWCDDGVQRVDELEEPGDIEIIKGEGAPGGGGTSVEPVFDWIKQQQGELPEVFIAFTDGYVDFVDPPPIPNIIWCMTTDVVAPYGETVRINT
jgi:predicted metal-dependent peptidase